MTFIGSQQGLDPLQTTITPQSQSRGDTVSQRLGKARSSCLGAIKNHPGRTGTILAVGLIALAIIGGGLAIYFTGSQHALASFAKSSWSTLQNKVFSPIAQHWDIFVMGAGAAIGTAGLAGIAACGVKKAVNCLSSSCQNPNLQYYMKQPNTFKSDDSASDS